MSMQLAALESALAAWPRRQAPLLEANCGNGAFLEFLWQCGFDAQGAEQDPDLRARALGRNVPSLEIAAAAADSLPFENDSFDWVIIHLESVEPEKHPECVSEGVRLARRGVMLTFWNSASIPALAWNLTHRKPWAENAASWWSVWRLLRGQDVGKIAMLSTLYAPMWAWKRQWRLCGAGSAPFGAWCIARLDLGPGAPATPLPLRMGAVLRKQDPALEPFNNEITETPGSAPSGNHQKPANI